MNLFRVMLLLVFLLMIVELNNIDNIIILLCTILDECINNYQPQLKFYHVYEIFF